MKKLSVIHPFLLALFPVLFLYAHNICEVFATDLLLLIVAVIAGTSILFFLLRLITKSYVKSGIITSWFLVLFFSYGYIRDFIYSLDRFEPCDPGDQTSVNLFLASLFVLLFITGTFLVIKSRSNFQTLTKFLNVTAITLIVISLINISVYEIKTINLGQGKVNEESGLVSTENLPDIYYIIFDEYARASTLKETFNYDNSGFIDYLTDKGFYVASRSRSNYPETKYSVASSLNMEYILERKSTPELFEMIQNNKVSQFLKSKGYRYIYTGQAFFAKGISKYAYLYDTTRILKMSNFTSFAIRSTALAPFAAHFNLINLEMGALILRSFDTLESVPNIKEPTFVYAHIMCPRIPFIFDSKGNFIKPIGREHTPEETKENYVDQLIFLNTKIKALVDEILSKSDVPPIIILQADHGWKGERPFDILNAYYLPESGNRLLYESITPVNSFRIIFNLYFDTDYDLLEDKSYNLDMTLFPPEK